MQCACTCSVCEPVNIDMNIFARFVAIDVTGVPVFLVLSFCPSHTSRKLLAATVVGMSFNAPAAEKGGWRPSKNPDDEPQCVVLVAERSPNDNGFDNGITVSPSDESNTIIGRIKQTASCVLAPLMRDGKVVVRANFNAGKFNLKANAINIDVFAGDDAISIERLLVQYVDFKARSLLYTCFICVFVTCGSCRGAALSTNFNWTPAAIAPPSKVE